MNVQEYISSGIIESYVMGLASPDEQREFEETCARYPEVLEARLAFEKLLEEEAMKQAIVPAPSLKEAVSTALFQKPATVVPLQDIKRLDIRRNSWLPYAAAAAVILLAASVFWNISLYNKNQQLQENYSSTVAKLEDIEEDLRMIRNNPNVKMAAMKGMEDSPESIATVYWDTTSKDVYLLVNNLPAPASDKQYQLWALLDGKPIDLGMLDNSLMIDQQRLLLRMKNVGDAQAFAITLETKGGNPTPKGPMYVMGNLHN